MDHVGRRHVPGRAWPERRPGELDEGGNAKMAGRCGSYSLLQYCSCWRLIAQSVSSREWYERGVAGENTCQSENTPKVTKRWKYNIQLCRFGCGRWLRQAGLRLLFWTWEIVARKLHALSQDSWNYMALQTQQMFPLPAIIDEMQKVSIFQAIQPINCQFKVLHINIRHFLSKPLHCEWVPL